MSDSHQRFAALSQRWFGQGSEQLDERQKRILKSALERQPLSRAPEALAGRASFGDRLADRVATFGGSWTFIICFGLVLAAWAGVNLELGRRAFDPYPFIFLNLMLSMLAAIQAPIIMMSQNRQAAKDRLTAQHDYEVNLKAEIEVMALHDKLDQLRAQDLQALIVKQQEQIELLRALVERKGPEL